MQIDCSIVITNYRRLEYLKRTLYSIAHNIWVNVKPQVVISEEISEQTPEILKEMNRYNDVFSWKIITYDMNEYTKATGLVKAFNNSSLGNNIAFNYSNGQMIFHQGNEVIALYGSYNKLLRDYLIANNLHTIVYSTTYDLPLHVLTHIGEFGELLNENHFQQCLPYLFQSKHKESLVTNYLSLCHRSSWKLLNGYDVRYLSGAACEDTSFSLRFRKLPNAKWIFSDGITLHQNHKGMSEFQNADPSIMTKDKWTELCWANKKIYLQEKDLAVEKGLSYSNFGIKEIIENKL